jgi:hypothetical protein
MHVLGSMMSDPGMATVHEGIDSSRFAELRARVYPDPVKI